MTPGLAGFTADGSELQSWDDVVAAVLAALATEFGVQPERTAPANSVAPAHDVAGHLRLAAVQGRA